ncbi:metallophosphoesterase family protein [Butyricicoccus sp.]|uniref:metallophosphoesterase family protein n=1 Tax=Butyricicoccus sp. TaxID=2049021 RepID=UPI003F182567
MNILALSDIESKYLWDYFHPIQLKNIDLIVSCGDLHPDYLSFIATHSRVPVLYVHGNHDDRYAQTPPEGCICIEDSIYTYNGVRILGLGGSMRYRNGVHQYTQAEMNRRVHRLYPKLWLHHGFDILLTHSPALGINDGSDLPHQGFQAFCTLIERYKPCAMIHGHTHLNYGIEFQRKTQLGTTKIVNAYERYLLSIET